MHLITPAGSDLGKLYRCPAQGFCLENGSWSLTMARKGPLQQMLSRCADPDVLTVCIFTP